MQPTTLIQPDFARRRWIDSDGAVHESPVARRATPTADRPHQRDDFGVAAENPRLVADLICSLERWAYAEPSIVIVRGEQGRPDRVQVDHAGHCILLTPADARLAAMAIEADPTVFEGCMGVAARLRDAALRIDFGAAVAPLLPASPATNDPADPPTLRMAGRTLILLGALLAFVCLMAMATELAGAR